MWKISFKLNISPSLNKVAYLISYAEGIMFLTGPSVGPSSAITMLLPGSRAFLPVLGKAP